MATARHLGGQDAFPAPPGAAGPGPDTGLGGPRLVPLSPDDHPVPSLGDVALGAATLGLGLAARLVHAGSSVVRPAAGRVLRPPGVPPLLQPAQVAQKLGRIGSARRGSLEGALSRLLDDVVPAVAETVLRRIDLTDVVLRRVDLDAVVAAVDLDAAAARLDVDAVLDRLDLTELVRERVDLDSVVEEVDLDAIVRRVDIGAVIDRLDLTALVRGRVDLNAIAAQLDVESILDRLDLTAVVRDRVDLDALVAGVDLDGVARRLDVEAVIERLDLTAIVLNRVDLDALVNAVLARIDLVGLAEEVIDAVDLPEIIRESTGSMASETVRGARMQGIHADEAVGRAVDRLLLRRARRHPGGPGDQPANHEPAEPRREPPGPGRR
jgi:hypothetical protein